MAACYETVTSERCANLLGRIEGLRISRPWLGYANVLFLELGKLHTETLKTRRRTLRTRKGQVCFMIEPNWRVEKRRSIQFGSEFSDARIAKGVPSLRGQHVERIELTDGLPELQVTFDDGRCLRTFADWDTQPAWTILVHDRSLADLASVWDGIDVTPCLHVEQGRLQIEYDFDDRDIDLRRLRRFRCPRLQKRR